MSLRQPEYALFPTEEYLARVSRARARMETVGVDALILTAKENGVYFSGLRTTAWNSKHRPTAVIVPRNDNRPVVSVISENIYNVSFGTSWIDDVRAWGGWKRKDAVSDPIVGIIAACKDLGVLGGTIGLELGYGQRLGMSQDDFGKLKAGLGDSKIVDVGSVMWHLRQIKSPLEVECIRKACDATTKAFERGFAAIKPGMTERELGALLIAEMALQTGEMPGFINIRSGPSKYGMMNVLPFEKPFDPGDLIVADLGANYKYYWSDYMRMACLGTPTAQQRHMFDVDRVSMQAGVDMIRPGITLGDIFDASYKVLLEGGLEEHVGQLERVGHGVGLDIHEPPSIARGSQVPVEPGMVLTVEPIFWDLPDAKIGNFAMEEVVLVTETGHEVLSTFSNDLYVL
jgi:Xaa-Pro aminopeptidase